LLITSRIPTMPVLGSEISLDAAFDRSVGVRVDDPRHYEFAAAVDHLGIRRRDLIARADGRIFVPRMSTEPCSIFPMRDGQDRGIAMRIAFCATAAEASETTTIKKSLFIVICSR